MGRFVSSSGVNGGFGVIGDGSALILPGRLPTFRSGHFHMLPHTTIFVVPAGVYRLRVRVNGGGAGSEAAQSSSFGSMISATGGQPGAGLVGGLGGMGVGGDFQAAGGSGGAGYRSGGGAAGSELGAGGRGGDGGPGNIGSGGGGGGVGGNRGGAGVQVASRPGGGGGSAFGRGQDATDDPSIPWGGPDITGRFNGFQNPGGVILAHLLDGFLGGGGYGPVSSPARMGGNGAGGGGNYGLASNGAGSSGGHGGFLGGGGGQGSFLNGPGLGGVCAPDAETMPALRAVSTATFYETRIGGGMGGTSARAGSGGGGYARGEFDVLPGQQIPVTVALQSSETIGVSGGLILVEY